MKVITLHNKTKHLNGTVKLPASKSISNRILIIQALSNLSFDIKNLSLAEDTSLMQNLLQKIESNKETGTQIDCGNAGTVFRFLTAFLANTQGQWKLTGSDRMKKRPVKILVDALIELGANIKYKEKSGYPPLLIRGNRLNGNNIKIDAGISSQYISALLMLAPILPEGLELQLSGKITSSPYIDMTLDIMQKTGISWKYNNSIIKIPPQKYQANSFVVESDWSSVAYWYEIASFSKEVNIFLPGLKKDSCQGDAILPEIYKKLGIQTDFQETGIRLIKRGKTVESLSFDFIPYPDLVQSVVVTCAGLNIPGEFIIPENLRIKETDRVSALLNELKKLGYEIKLEKTENHSILSLQKTEKQLETNNVKTIKTYEDHRMAMAFAPLCLLHENLQIEKPEVVSKSYPSFWEDLKKMGLI